MKTTFKILAVIFLIAGFFLLLNSISGITGFIIVEEISVKISGLLGLVFVLVGVLMLAERKGKKQLEKIILISKQARERSEKDPRIRQNMQRYRQEIKLIAADPIHRPQEIIGQFHISPRSRAGGGLRVAWHRKINTEEGKEIIYIDDFLYHINPKDYTDFWNKKADRNEITPEDYEFEE